MSAFFSTLPFDGFGRLVIAIEGADERLLESVSEHVDLTPVAPQRDRIHIKTIIRNLPQHAVERKSIWAGDALHAELLAPPNLDAIGLARLIRGRVVEYLGAHGFRGLHSSAIERGGKVAIFTGDAEAGKTSSVLSCLLDTSFRYLGNDRILLRRSQEALQALPIGYSLAIRPEVAASFPELDESTRSRAMGELANDKDRVMERDLLRSFGVQRSSGGSVAMIIFPEFGMAYEKVELRPVSRDVARHLFGAQNLDLTFGQHDDFEPRHRKPYRLPIAMRTYRLRFGPSTVRNIGPIIAKEWDHVV